jgi:hypothetical protein
MKKVILTGVALMAFAAAGFAQNSSTVNQAGDNQTATAQQLGNAQVSNIQQTEGTGQNEGNTATTIQGTMASPNVTGVNTAEIFQRNGSTFNRAGATQSGEGNTSTITQDASGGASMRGGSPTVGAGSGKGNYAGTLQDGSDNTATINQNGAGTQSNFGEIYQYGSTNQGTINQAAGATDNAVTIKQGTEAADVERNEATVSQDQGGSLRNTTTVLQTGDGGIVNVQQRNNSTDNEASINQVSGEGSRVDVQQSFGAFRNQTNVVQYGDNQLVSVEQVASSDNDATINQGSAGTTSSGNRARVYQKDGAQQSDVTINQNVTANGGNNYAQVEQAYPSGSSIDNSATVNQEGSSNSVRLSQTGAGGHLATIDQIGDGNVVKGPGTSLYEAGPMAVQNGHGHIMDVDQTSSNGFTNTASIGQTGTSNNLDLDQTATAASNIATVTQSGMMNQAVIQQNGVMP